MPSRGANNISMRNEANGRKPAKALYVIVPWRNIILICGGGNKAARNSGGVYNKIYAWK